MQCKTVQGNTVQSSASKFRTVQCKDVGCVGYLVSGLFHVVCSLVSGLFGVGGIW